MVDVVIYYSAATLRAKRQQLQVIPQQRHFCAAIVDTGADTSAVDTSIVQGLQLPLAGFAIGNAPALGGSLFPPLYDVSLRIVHPSGNPRLDLFLAHWQVVDLSLNVLGYSALVGRDILGRCRFHYEGTLGNFSLSY